MCLGYMQALYHLYYKRLEHTWILVCSMSLNQPSTGTKNVEMFQWNMGINLCNLGLLLVSYIWKKTTGDERKKNKLDFLKVKNLCASTVTIQKVKI